MALSRSRSGGTSRGPSVTAGSAGKPAMQRVVKRRIWSIGITWLLILVFIGGPLLLGNWLFLIPAVGFTVAAVATMRLARRPDGPDAETLAPGALKAATTTQPVVVHGTWSAGGGGARGTLRCAGKRLSFVTDEGDTTFEVPINKVRLVTVPGFWRPQLDLDIGGTTHTVRFFPLWDLGATVVGP